MKKRISFRKSEVIGENIEVKLKELQGRYTFAGEIRRLGSMVAVEIVHNRRGKAPNKLKAMEIVQYANANGLLLLSAGLSGNVIRFSRHLSSQRKKNLKRALPC
ncbi:aminotransferase class III-fold pyridoxal phosphate-dependent enzyme [Oceanobacillus sp. FSL H7-0719]|uniref:aminotransferase class III-fold pyridoxal phosphate-dependent enzyme n=1 Tax=Oceanobacillus sp. FSL H7-0719 TaxID=2954507 RepID=UPI0032552C1C